MNYSNKKFSLKIVYSLALVLFFTSVKLIAQPLVADGGPDQTICNGASIGIGGAPTANFGTPGYTYSWAPTSGLSATNVSNPTANPTGTTTYTITVTDAVATTVTDVVTITVVATPTTSNAGPNQSVCGTTATLAGNTPTVGTGLWTLVSGTGTITTPTSPTSGLTGLGVGPNVFQWTISNAPCAASTSTVTITVTPLPATPTPGSNSPICDGTNLNLTGPAVGGASYSWTGPNSFSSTLQNPTIIAASTLAAGTYSLTVTVGGCTSLVGTTSVIVNPLPTVNPTVTPLVCNGATVGGISFFSTPGGATFNWTNSNPAIGLAASGAGNLPSFTATNSGSTVIGGTVSVIATLAGCVGPAYNFSPSVKPTPIATSSPMTQTRCSGVNCNFALNSTVAGTTYSWTTTGTGVSGNTPSSGTVISQSVTATTTSPGTANYYVTPIAAGCAGTTINPVLTVNPVPVATSTTSPLTRCSGDTVSFSVSSNVSGTTFTWSSFSTNASGADPSGTGTSVFDTVTATTAAAGTITYIFTPVAAGCTGSQAFPFVNVNPIADATPSPATYPPTCSGDAVVVAFSSSSGGVTFNWTSSEFNTSGSSLSGTGNITETLTATAAGATTYTITPTVGGCNGTPITYVINVNPFPIATFSYVSPACQNTPNIFPMFGPGASAGNFTFSPAGLVITPSTGEIDLTLSTAGAYSITNTIAAAGGCPSTNSNTGFSIDPYMDPTITNVSNVCSNSAPFNFVAASPGGVWSGTGITNSSTGTFDPAVSGLGTFTISYQSAGPCFFMYSDTTVIVVANADIYGKVTYSGGDLNSGANTAVLFDYSSSFFSFDSVQVSTIDALGYYHFTSIPPGDYLIEVFADTLVYPLAVPTYYDSEFLWDTAMVLNHSCATDTADVFVIEGIVTSGPGMITGFVNEGWGFVRAPGDPIPGLDVKLGKNPGGSMVTNTQTTSPLGAYAFSNLAINSPGEYYTVYVDIPGLQRDSVWNITITATNTVFTNINYIADSNSVYPFFPTTVSIVSAEIENSLIVFPNPTNASATIEYTLTNSSSVKLEVVDVLGKQLESLVNTNQPAGNYKVNLAKLNAGIYFIRLNINNHTNTTRLVVTD